MSTFEHHDCQHRTYMHSSPRAQFLAPLNDEFTRPLHEFYEMHEKTEREVKYTNVPRWKLEG